MPFANKIALITGSGRGIGQALAVHFAREGRRWWLDSHSSR